MKATKPMTRTQKIQLRKTILTYTKAHTYRETAAYLARNGFKTPRGRKPSLSFISNVIAGVSLRT